MMIGRNVTKSLRCLPPLQFTPRRLYHQKVIDHFNNPKNVGKLDQSKKNVGTGLVGAPACGDVMRIHLEFDDNDKVVDAKFQTFGCTSAIASSSLATQWVIGKPMSEAKQLKNTQISQELCLPPVKLHCSMLAQDAIHAAIENYKQKKSD